METYISKCKKYKLEIIKDFNSESPDAWGDSELFLVYDHRQFFVKRDGFNPEDIYDYICDKYRVEKLKALAAERELTEKEREELEDYEDNINSQKFEDYYIFNVKAYIHSNVTLSLGSLYSVDNNDKFDVSNTGFILINKKEVSESFTKELAARELAEGLIETWNQYLSGDVYSFTLYEANKRYFISADNFQHLIDSGHGFDDYTRNEYFTEELDWGIIDSYYGFYGYDFLKDDILEYLPQDVKFDL